MKEKGYIYRIENQINYKSYVGQTFQKVEDRWRQHISEAFKKGDKKKYAIHYALKKYGVKNFLFEIIEVLDCEKEELDERERYWIKTFHSHYSENRGYNLTWGGEGRQKANTEKILALWNEGNDIKEIAQKSGYADSTCALHLKLNGITNQEIQYRRYEKIAEKCSKKVYQYDFQGNLIAEWGSLAQLHKKTGYEQSLISLAANRKVRYAYGYIWTYSKDELKEALAFFNQKRFKKNRPVGQFDLKGNLIKVWESAELAGRETAAEASAIRRVCNKAPRYKTSGGFVWKYMDEIEN